MFFPTVHRGDPLCDCPQHVPTKRYNRNTPVLPSTDTEVFSFPLLVVTVMVYCLPGMSTLNVHSLMLGSTFLVAFEMLPMRQQ